MDYRLDVYRPTNTGLDAGLDFHGVPLRLRRRQLREVTPGGESPRTGRRFWLLPVSLQDQRG